jgi:hypothetical protein
MQRAEYAWCGVAEIFVEGGRPLEVHDRSNPVTTLVNETPVAADGPLQAGR